MALGTRFAEADASSWESEYTFNFQSTKLIHIDIDPNEIGRNYPVEIGAVADLKQALTVLNRVAKERLPEGLDRPELKKDIAAYREEFQKSNLTNIQDESFPMKPQRILQEVREVLPPDAFITTDVGWNKMGSDSNFLYTRQALF